VLTSAYRQVLQDPATVEAICEDYRAGAGIDRAHDDADLGVRRIHCPLLAPWSAGGALPRLYAVLGVWRPWAREVTGRGLEASHFLVEDWPRPSRRSSPRRWDRAQAPVTTPTHGSGGLAPLSHRELTPDEPVV